MSEKTNKINNANVNLFYDLVDKACMLYYNELGIDYLEAFIKVVDALTDEFDELKFKKSTIVKINAILEKIANTKFLNEEVRLASVLILVKGFKHRNLLLDFMTPDVINYLFVHIIKSIIENVDSFKNKKELVILDTVLGTSNLLQTIINNIDNDINISGIGIEQDQLLVMIAKALSNLLNNDLIINYNNATSKINGCCDIIIGDFGETNDVYQIISERLDNLNDQGFFIYVINNDFFEKATESFKKIVSSSATLIGLIVLPNAFTNASHIGKSILIGKKELLNDYQMSIIKMNDDLSKESLELTFVKILNIFKEIGGNKNA